MSSGMRYGFQFAGTMVNPIDVHLDKATKVQVRTGRNLSTFPQELAVRVMPSGIETF
jgi:hypothetical protein